MIRRHWGRLEQRLQSPDPRLYMWLRISEWDHWWKLLQTSTNITMASSDGLESLMVSDNISEFTALFTALFTAEYCMNYESNENKNICMFFRLRHSNT